MTNLRETVARAILARMGYTDSFADRLSDFPEVACSTLADAAIAAMQPTLDRLERERDKAQSAIQKQASAIRSLRANEGTEINILRSKSREAHEAVKTLDSERTANFILTDELETVERQRDAALDALNVARNAINKAANQFEFYAENHSRKKTADGDRKAEVNRNLGGEMRKALAQIDAITEGEGL